MTVSTRRDFIKTSAAAAAAMVVPRRVWAQKATLKLTFSGLCCLVDKHKDGIDLVLPRADGHSQTLKHPKAPKGEPIAGYSLALTGLTPETGPVTLPKPMKCGKKNYRWFANLSTLAPYYALVDYPDGNDPCHIASFLPLTGGAIELYVSSPKQVPGIHEIWDLSWEKEYRQVLVEVAEYSAVIAAGQVTLTKTPIAGGPGQSVTFDVPPGQTLDLSLSNDTGLGERSMCGVLQHFNHYAYMFRNLPQGMRHPKGKGSCDTHMAPPLTPATQRLLDAIHRGESTITINGKQCPLTADDPICPIAYCDPGVRTNPTR